MAKGPPFAPALRAAASRTWRCGVYSSSGRAGAERSAGARPAFASKGKKDLALQNRPRYLAGVFPRTGLARQLVAQLLGRDALRAPFKGRDPLLLDARVRGALARPVGGEIGSGLEEIGAQKA